MPMIPDAGPPAQPTELYRVDVFISETKTASAIFNATEADVDAEALRIVAEQKADHGDVYQLIGTDRAVYYDTVWAWSAEAPLGGAS